MERFAIINDKIRLNLYNICRLCGIDNPSKIKILDSLKKSNDSDEEPSLSKKIECVVGIKVKRNDQMPQSICTLCADKINDFFEYREMCGATNIQTRKLLGIPLDVPKRKRLTDKEIKAEGESILGLGIEDEDIADSKSSVKSSGKHRIKGRPKRKGSSSSSKKKVYFKDEEDEVKLEFDEMKTEIQPINTSSNKNVGKRLKIDVKRSVDPTPLLTQKEPNKRERRREIDAQKLERRRIREEQKREIEEKKRQIELAKQILEQKKLEKKRKRKNSDPEPPIKKLKQELEVSITSLRLCNICSETFPTGDLLSTHLHQSHTVTISAYGCSSCAESYKSLDEERDHELWHSLSKTSYICPICNVAFDKASVFTRHINLCKPFTLTPTVTNRHCKNCSQDFLTENLYQWHNCFVKANGTCWHCNRMFVKASSLFKHSFKCSNGSTTTSSSTDSTHKDTHIANATTVSHNSGDSKKNRKARTVDRDSHIKSEPEANLDIDVSSSASHLLTSDMLPVVVLTKTIFKPNHSFAIHTDDMSIKHENDLDFEDNSHLDEPFRDGDDSDNDNDDADQMNGIEGGEEGGLGGGMTAFSDDDVILIENNEEPVLVNGSPSGARSTVTSKPFVLPIVIKREPVDTYEVMTSPVYSPTKAIKSEPLDDHEMERHHSHHSPKRSSLKNRKSKKSTHKSYKDRQHLVHIKQEPVDPDDIYRKGSTHDMGSAIVSLPTTNLLETTIKQEPIRPGYGDDDFDPVLAMNIKKEPGLDDSGSSKLPSLRLIISKKHGTLNSKLISAQDHNAEAAAAAVETSPKATKTKRVKDKCLYKKPALLAEKIRQEMIARMARGDKGHERRRRSRSTDETNDFTVPVIARVLDANAISDLPLVRVKIEPRSPCHSPSNRIDTESILETSIDALRYDPFSSDRFPSPIDGNACNSAMVDFDSLEPPRTPTDSEDLKSLLDIETLCGIAPVSSSAELPPKQATKTSDSQNVPTDAHESIAASAATDDLMELAGMTLSEFMNQRTSNDDESNGHRALEAAGYGDHHHHHHHHHHHQQQQPVSTTDLIANSFDPMRSFNDTGDHHHCQMNQNSFKIPDENKMSYEEINEIISTLPPLSVEPNGIKEVISLNSNVQSTATVVSNATASNASSELLSSKETADGKQCSAFSDNSESNELNYSSGESQAIAAENEAATTTTLANQPLKSTDLANGGRGDGGGGGGADGCGSSDGCGAGVGDVNDTENELLKRSVHDTTDYELNSVQTLTTSAIHEQLDSLLEDISEESLSCNIDLDGKDWEWESKLLGD